MAENQILPFAYADGANVMSQNDYLADNQRLIGNQPGIARSAFVNKSLLQALVMASGLAQFIADGQSADVTDAKTPAEIAAMLLAASTAQMPMATQAAAGKVRMATTTEARALTSNGVALSPAVLKYAFQSSDNAVILPDGSSFQFMSPQYDAGSGDELTVRATYPFAFDVPPFVIAGVFGDNNATAGGLTVKAQEIDATGFSLVFRRGNNAPLSGTLQAAWLAVGKIGG